MFPAYKWPGVPDCLDMPVAQEGQRLKMGSDNGIQAGKIG
jgi:hypothetical protein